MEHQQQQQSTSEWVKGLALAAMGAGETDATLKAAASGETVKESEVLAAAMTFKATESLRARIGVKPAGLTHEQLIVLDHSVRKLDEAGAKALNQTESAALFLTPQTSELAAGAGVPPPPADPSVEWQRRQTMEMDQILLKERQLQIETAQRNAAQSSPALNLLGFPEKAENGLAKIAEKIAKTRQEALDQEAEEIRRRLSNPAPR